MKNTMIIVLASAGLLALGQVASAQEGGGEVSGSASVSAGGEASASTNSRVEPASAGAPGGKIGVGGTFILSGAGGLEGTYHVSDKLMINAVLAFDSLSPKMGNSTTTIGFAASGFFNLAGHSWADLYGGARLGYLKGSRSLGGMNVDRSAVVIELPLRLELKLHRRLSLHFETGIAIDLISDSFGGMSQSSTGFVIGANAFDPIAGGQRSPDIFATGGFTILL